MGLALPADESLHQTGRGTTLDSMPANKRGGRGHPRRRPLELHADKGSDERRVWRQLWLPPEHRWGRRAHHRLAAVLQRLGLRHEHTAVTITALTRLAIPWSTPAGYLN